MRAALLVLLVAGCWREPAERSQPELSFVARVNVLTDLRTRTSALAPKLDYAMQRIRGLASEAERAAIRDDLNALDLEVRQLSAVARDARERDENRELLDDVDRKLAQAARGLAGLHEDLLHAKTLAEQEAFDELKKKTEGTLDRGGIETFRINTLPPAGAPLLTPPLFERPLTP